jgi:hypothetical protein
MKNVKEKAPPGKRGGRENFEDWQSRMFSNPIIAQQQNVKKPLKKSLHYLMALQEIGIRKIERTPRGQILIDGRPKNRITMGCIKTELRDRDFQFSYSWLIDVISLLAYRNADLDKPETWPDWMRPWWIRKE